MQTRLLNLAIFPVVLFLLAGTGASSAQTNFRLYSFARYTNTPGILGVNTNRDGIGPNGWLTLSGTNFYGTTQSGGTNGSGTLFAISTNGVFRLLYTFAFDDVAGGSGNTYGANPNGGLVLSGVTLYGTAAYGGASDQGVIFSISTNGAGIQSLHTFTDFTGQNTLGLSVNTDGANPNAGLVLGGAKLFGTAEKGGSGGNGVVFACTTSKTFTVLKNFSAGNYNDLGIITNSDGANPSSRLVLLGTNLFGTTSAGGTNGLGTLFRVSTNGVAFTTLYHFDNNGANPKGGLVLSSGFLFGISGSIVYAVRTNGANFTILQQFDGVVDDTSIADSGLTVSNGTLYGVASSIGDFGNGQIFSLNTNGLGFADFHDFTELPLLSPRTNFDGALPSGGLVLLNNSLYGAAGQGGVNGSGVLFRALPPPPAIMPQLSGKNLSFSFPTVGGMSYTVQQNTNLMGTNWLAFTNILGNDTVKQFSAPTTNGLQRYFRVRSP